MATALKSTAAFAASDADAEQDERERLTDVRTDRLFELTGRFRAGNVVTRTSDALLRSRPMTLALLDSATEELGFLTLVDSDIVREVGADPMVSVVFQDARHHVAWSGRASIDAERYRVARVWQPELTQWFPEGPDDPRVVLLVVRAIRAEYWSASIATGALRALGMRGVGPLAPSEDAPQRHGVVMFGDDGILTEW